MFTSCTYISSYHIWILVEILREFTSLCSSKDDCEEGERGGGDNGQRLILNYFQQLLLSSILLDTLICMINYFLSHLHWLNTSHHVLDPARHFVKKNLRLFFMKKVQK